MNLPRLLAIDDDETVLALVRGIASDSGYDVQTTSSPASLIALFRQFEPALVLLDLAMPGGDGVKLMRQLAQAHCTAKVAILSGADGKTMAAALRLGREYGLEMAPGFAKPFEPDALRVFLENVRGALREVSPTDLLDALQHGEFEVRYQPKVDLRTTAPKIIGAEALVRWRHPRRGLLTANRFVPMAEEEGLIEPLSSWVLSEVLRQLTEWEAEKRSLMIAVNLPSSLLGDLDFPDQVEAMLEHSGVSPHRLMLEITERGAMRDGPTAIDVLTRFRLKGVSLAIDDFGVGHSSLVELYRMPFNELKIDASFVRDMLTSREAQTIVRTLITLAHELGLEACAEGVESAAVSQMLRAMKCDKAQGFLYGSAMTATELEAWLSDTLPDEWTPTAILRSEMAG